MEKQFIYQVMRYYQIKTAKNERDVEAILRRNNYVDFFTDSDPDVVFEDSDYEAAKAYYDRQEADGTHFNEYRKELSCERYELVRAEYRYDPDEHLYDIDTLDAKGDLEMPPEIVEERENEERLNNLYKLYQIEPNDLTQKELDDLEEAGLI